MKFTEEQYQTIVEMFEKVNDEYNMGFLNPNIVIFFQDKLYKEFGEVLYFVEDWQTITAFANPLTREWAHEQYVEEEKKYLWTLKKVDKRGIKMYLHKDYFGRVGSFLSVKNVNIDDSEKLTETEVREWGYDPERFDKEEVE